MDATQSPAPASDESAPTASTYGPNRGRSPAERNVTARLFLAAAVISAVAIVADFTLTRAVYDFRVDPADETFAIWLHYTFIACAAIAQAIWIDAQFFGGEFRRQHLSFASKKAKPAESALNAQNADEALAASFSKSHLFFAAALLACGVASYNLHRFVNHGFDRYYQDVGRSFAKVRAFERGQVDLASVQDDFETLAYSPRPEVAVFLLQQLDATRAEVVTWSAWALGRRRDASIRRSVVEPLVRVMRKGEAQSQREAMVALARLQHRSVAATIEDKVKQALDRGEDPDLRTLWSLSYTQSPTSLGVLEKALYSSDSEVARVAAFALAQLRETSAARQAVKLLEDRLPAANFALRCAIVHALGILASEDSNFALMHAFDAVAPAQRNELCPSTRMLLRPDGQGNDVHLLFISSIRNSPETFTMVTLLAMGSMRATAPHVRAVVEPWLEKLAGDPSYGDDVRMAIHSLLDGIRKARDSRLPAAT